MSPENARKCAHPNCSCQSKEKYWAPSARLWKRRLTSTVAAVIQDAKAERTNSTVNLRRNRRFRVLRSSAGPGILERLLLERHYDRLPKRWSKAEGPPCDGPSGEKSSKANARMARKPFYNRKFKRQGQIKSSGKGFQG